jgi:hypothetical protein
LFPKRASAAASASVHSIRLLLDTHYVRKLGEKYLFLFDMEAAGLVIPPLRAVVCRKPQSRVGQEDTASMRRIDS